jgi:hypothetical protein
MTAAGGTQATSKRIRRRDASKSSEKQQQKRQHEYDISGLCWKVSLSPSTWTTSTSVLSKVTDAWMDGYEVLSDVMCGRVHDGCIPHIPGADNILADTLFRPPFHGTDQIAFYLPTMPDQIAVYFPPCQIG